MKKVFVYIAAAALTLSVGFQGCKKEGTKTHTVTFDSNEGTPVEPQTIKDGEKAKKPADPTRSGYTFASWYKEAALTTEWKFDTDVVIADIVLYAKWIMDKVQLLEKVIYDGWYYKFEYDDQKRLINKSWYQDNGNVGGTSTFTYSGNDLVKFVDFGGTTYEFTKNVNQITIVGTTTSNSSVTSTLSLNSDGLPVKLEENFWTDYFYVRTFQYQDGNLLQITETVTYSGVTNSGSLAYKYDDKKSPLYHCKTPKWFFYWWIRHEGFDVFNHVNQNNLIERPEFDDLIFVYSYTYDSAGFPTKCKETEFTDGVKVYEENSDYTYIMK